MKPNILFQYVIERSLRKKTGKDDSLRQCHSRKEKPKYFFAYVDVKYHLND